MLKKLYKSDEDKMMQDKSLTWSEPAIVNTTTIIQELRNTINKIKKHCETEVKINEDEETHFSKMSDGTDGICEGRLEFAEGVINIINNK